MAIIDIEIRERGPYQDGQVFGETGAYERLDGWARFAVDPEHPANAAIVDLERAPRDEQGRVHFGADICLLVPADQAKANRRLFVELPNRGRKLLSGIINRAPGEVPPTANIPAGDGFLYRHGWTVGWIGWQWDVYRTDALMGLEPPIAMEDGKSVEGWTNVRFQANFVHHSRLLADRIHQPYPVIDVDQPDAVLTVRDFDDDAPREIPRSEWSFAREDGGDIVPSNEHFYLSSGFQPGKIYQIVYRTNHAPVVGSGLLAFRDAASFLRYSDSEDNPLRGLIDHAYGWGVSQTGRMLRHFLFLGLNLDEEGRSAYDGIIPHVGGGRRGEFNHRFGQPSVQSTPGFGFLSPHDDASVLKRLRENGAMPKVIQTNSSAEYWRGDSSLMTMDIEGTTDLPAEPDTRTYLYASTQHGPGHLPRTRVNATDGSTGQVDFNLVDYSPLQRATLTNLDRWVSEGIEPPPSAHPRLDDETAVTRAEVLEAFRVFPVIGTNVPNPDRIIRLREVELGPRVEEGIATYPITEGVKRPDYVSAVDADGNELAGIRMPDVSVPIATLTGWNPRDPETGAPDQIILMQGMTLNFARTAAEREAANDPRPSVEERYAGRDDYLAKVRAAAEQLAAQRYILDEDIDICVSDAAERWDEYMGSYGR